MRARFGSNAAACDWRDKDEGRDVAVVSSIEIALNPTPSGLLA
jgi:hypothetical protein